MTDVQAFYGAIALVVLAIVYIIRVVLEYKGKFEDAKNLEKYKTYAVMAAKKVEGLIPDDYGAGSSDPTVAKAAHKLDLFLKYFSDNVKTFEGENVTEKLIDKAKEWSVELADRVSK